MTRPNRSFGIAVLTLAGSLILFVYTMGRTLTIEPVQVPPAPTAAPVDSQAAPSVEGLGPAPDTPEPQPPGPGRQAPGTAPRKTTPARPAPGKNEPAGEKGADERLASAPARGPAGELSTQAFALLVRNDPFSPTREAADPYRLPGEDVFEAPQPVRTPPPPQFRVFGTVVAPSGGIALLQLDDRRHVVSVGEAIAGYRLTHVDDQTATIEANGRLISYRVEDPAPRRPTRTVRTAPNGQNTQNGQQNAQEAAVRAEMMRQQVLQGALERLQQVDSASPEMRGQIMELLRRNLETPERMLLQGNTTNRIVRPRQDTSGTRLPRNP